MADEYGAGLPGYIPRRKPSLSEMLMGWWKDAAQEPGVTLPDVAGAVVGETPGEMLFNAAMLPSTGVRARAATLSQGFEPGAAPFKPSRAETQALMRARARVLESYARDKAAKAAQGE